MSKSITFRNILVSCLLLLCSGARYGYAQGVERITQFAIGTTNRLDTYLSPGNYTGNDIRFISSVMRNRTMLTHDGGLDFTDNAVSNAHTLGGHYDAAFSYMKPWSLLDGNLTLKLGGMAEAYLGFAYNMRNSANNPAQAYASLHAGLSGMAQYALPLQVCKRRVRLTYEARLPMVGIMFSPNYGQSYYEIFDRGDYDHNIVANTIATPSFRHQLSVDLPIGKTTALRLGYLGDIRQATPNHLRQHTYTNSIIIGCARAL